MGKILLSALSNGMRSTITLADETRSTLQPLIDQLHSKNRLKATRGKSFKDLFGDLLGLLWLVVVSPIIEVLGIQKSDF